MHLHDPKRPQVNGLPLYLNSYTVITGLRAFPTSNTQIELSAFLPVTGEAMTFAKRFTTRIDVGEVDSWLKRFVLDPEETLEALFADDAMRPALRDVDSRNEGIEELETLDFA